MNDDNVELTRECRGLWRKARRNFYRFLHNLLRFLEVGYFVNPNLAKFSGRIRLQPRTYAKKENFCQPTNRL